MTCVPNLGFIGGGSRYCDIRAGDLVPSSNLRLDACVETTAAAGVGLGEVTMVGPTGPRIGACCCRIDILGGGCGVGDERTFMPALCGGTKLLRGGGVLCGGGGILGTLGVTGIIPRPGIIGVAEPVLACARCLGLLARGAMAIGATGVGAAFLCICGEESNLRLGLLGSGALGIIPGV